METKGGVVRSRLKQLIATKELAEGRRISQQEIADATGLRRATVNKWMSPKPLGRIDDRVIVSLSAYLKLEHVGQLLFVDADHSVS